MNNVKRIEKQIEEILENIEIITGGKEIVELETLIEIEEIPNIVVENAGTSGTGQGQLYVIYHLDEMEETVEIAEIIVK